MNSREFIITLDKYFERDDMAAAGEYLEKVRNEHKSRDGVLLTVLNEMMGRHDETL